MKDKWESCLSHAVGIRGVHINSALVSAQQRKRIYWSNIRVRETGEELPSDYDTNPFAMPNKVTDIPQPDDRGIVISDILQKDTDTKYYLNGDVVKQLIDRTDTDKLRCYLFEPQISVDELLNYMEVTNEYASLSEEEKKNLATLAYDQEKGHLNQ